MSEEAILIVDDDEHICYLLEKVVPTWGMSVRSVTNPLLVAEELTARFYNVVLLDVYMPGMSGMDLLVKIGELCPETKVIIMTGYADRELAIRALRLGAFDLLEKPLTLDLIYHAVKRALDTQRAELEHKKTLDELMLKNKELMETNEALSILAKNIERTRKDTERNIIIQIRSLIYPIIETLKNDRKLKTYESQLERLTECLDEVSSDLVETLQGKRFLSFRELGIALMIKNGMANDEIAELLHIAPETVKSHRRNIRKKLGIMGTKRNLTSYLQSIDDDLIQAERFWEA